MTIGERLPRVTGSYMKECPGGYLLARRVAGVALAWDRTDVRTPSPRRHSSLLPTNLSLD